MTDQLKQSLSYTSENHELFLNDLKTILRIPSISTSPEHKPDMLRTADTLAGLLQQAGLENIAVMPTLGNPVVYADWLHAGSSAPTVMVYGHYDVQPVDPLDLWTTSPFEPTLRGDQLFARGSSDMKGQVIASISAVRAILKNGPLPVNVKFMLEGEEEIGSPNLREFLQTNSNKLACDVSLNPDAGMISPEIPSITYALRGLAFFEIKVTGPDHDLHSGGFGGLIHNPANALCKLISGMHDAEGRVTLPGFYDQVRPLSENERKELSRLPMTDADYLKQTGALHLWGDPNFTPTERLGARPTLDVNGMISGFTGAGTKTVLPSIASAKISCRLVADQAPAEIHQSMRTYLEQNAPDDIRWELNFLGGSPACATDPNNPAAQALSKAMETVWGTRPVFKREGGSVPVVGDIQKILGADSVLTGFGLPDDLIHSPNEHLHLPTWTRGIDALVHFFFNFGGQ